MKNGFFEHRWSGVFLVVITLSTLFIQLGRVPLFDEDEGAYAEVSREMITTGDWLVPHLEGQPFFHKPPMIYWTQALCMRIFGVNEFAARLPSAVASAAWALILFLFVRRFMEAQTAWMTVFFLVTALQTNIIAKAAIADALLNLFITATMLALFTHYRTGRRGWLLLTYAAMGLGFLTKGPIALAIPVVVSAAFSLIQKNILRWLKMIIDPWGWLILLLIAAPWYLALIAKFGMKFVGEIFLVHNLGRFENAMEGHSGPFYYYIPVILLGLLPYTTLVIHAFSKLHLRWRSELGRYLILWFAFVLLFFSFAETKLQHYIIYGYVPLLIFMAESVRELKRPVWLMLPVIIFALTVMFLPDLAGWSLPHITDDFSKRVIRGALEGFGGVHYLIAIIFLAAVLIITFIKSWSPSRRIIVTGLMFMSLITFYLMPKVADIMQAPIKEAALVAKKQGADVIMWQMNYPSFNVYLGRPVLRRPPLPGDIVITKANKLDGLGAYRILFEKHGFVLIQIEDNKPT